MNGSSGCGDINQHVMRSVCHARISRA